MDFESLQGLKRNELQKLCKKYKLKATGKNEDLLSRIQQYLQSVDEDCLQLPNQQNIQANDKTLSKQKQSNVAEKVDTNQAKNNSKYEKESKNTKKKTKSRKNKKKEKTEDEEKENSITKGITDEKFIAYINTASDEDAGVSNISQEMHYELPCVGKDSVFIPGKLAEPLPKVEISIPGSNVSTPVLKETGSTGGPKLIAKISPLLTSTVNLGHHKEADGESFHNSTFDGSFVSCRNNNATPNICVYDSTVQANETFVMNETTSSLGSVFKTPTNHDHMNDTRNDSDWLKSCQRANQSNRKFMEETFSANKIQENQSLALKDQSNSRRETFLVDNKTIAVDKRKTYFIAKKPANDSHKETMVLQNETQSGTFPNDRRKTYLITGVPGKNAVSNKEIHIRNGTVCDPVRNIRRETFLIPAQPDKYPGNATGDTEDRNQTQALLHEKEAEYVKRCASATNNNSKKELKPSVNSCVVHDKIMKSSDWKCLVLIGGFVYVDEESPESGERYRFVLQACGKPTPSGYDDNMICNECFQLNQLELEKREIRNRSDQKSSTTSPDLQTASPKKLTQRRKAQTTQHRNKRKWDESDEDNVSSRSKKRRSEVIIEFSKRGSPGSPQVRRARGEKIELSRRLLEPWKPRKNSIFPNGKREDTTFAQRVEEILQSVKPGSEEEMALIMQKKPKLSQN